MTIQAPVTRQQRLSEKVKRQRRQLRQLQKSYMLTHQLWLNSAAEQRRIAEHYQQRLRTEVPIPADVHAALQALQTLTAEARDRWRRVAFYGLVCIALQFVLLWAWVN